MSDINTWPRVIRVEVTAEDLKKGKRKCGDSCAVALALKREFGYDAEFLQNVNVDYNWAVLYAPGDSQRTYITSAGTRERIIAFDKGKPLKPFTCVLEASGGWV